jgi:hypothetical protein
MRNGRAGGRQIQRDLEQSDLRDEMVGEHFLKSLGRYRDELFSREFLMLDVICTEPPFPLTWRVGC